MLEIRDGNETLPRSVVRYKSTLLICAAIFLLSFLLVYYPVYFDYPIEHAINSVAGKIVFIDDLFFDLDTFFTLSGAILVSFIWACWFGTTDLETRGRILMGTLVSLGAGAISRFLQHTLSSHPRPFYDQAFGFHLPSMMSEVPFNTWDSFPSDHAAVFGVLVVVIFLARPKLGWLAGAWFFLLELSRAYMGAHYPTDLVGGAALGAFMVWLAQMPAVVSWAGRVALWNRTSPVLFYMAAFFLSYQIATLLQDFRSMSGGVHLIHELKDLVSGH